MSKAVERQGCSPPDAPCSAGRGVFAVHMQHAAALPCLLTCLAAPLLCPCCSWVADNTHILPHLDDPRLLAIKYEDFADKAGRAGRAAPPGPSLSAPLPSRMTGCCWRCSRPWGCFRRGTSVRCLRARSRRWLT